MVFTASLYDVRVKRNGGRIQLDFGVDAIAVVQEIAARGALKDMNFTFAVLQEEPEKEKTVVDEPYEPVDF